MTLFNSMVRFFSSGSPQPESRLPDKQKQEPLSSDFEENVQKLKSIYADSSDVINREFTVGDGKKAMLLYIEYLSSKEMIDEYVLTPLMREAERDSAVQDMQIPITIMKTIETFDDCVEQISVGNPVLMLEAGPACYSLGLSKMEKRNIEEPSAEGVVRGPREGFVELIGINISLLRRKIRSPELKVKMFPVGSYTQTRIAVAYIQGIADPDVVEEVTARLKRIDIDGILESGYIEEFIDDNPWSIFPQSLSTERPDTVASALLEGRVAILTDGTPFVLVVPITLVSLLQTAEDYYQRFYVSTFTRWLRFTFAFIALLLPSLYVGILTFHQEMIPTTLLIRIAKSREEVPFPALVEAILMEITFEALREAGIRLPKQVGAAVSIVGALVIGQAAVSAGLVSAPMVMVVAITGIASFMMPR